MIDEITRILAALLVVGCGRISDTGSHDAPTVVIDAAVDALGPACDLTKPFSAATEVLGLHDPMASDTHATFTADELTVYFGLNRFDDSSTMHLYVATRSTRDDIFSAPTIVSSTYSDQGESNPSISPDGNTIYFDSYRTSTGLIHIFTATRSNAAVVFPAATMIDGDYLNTPSITADGKVLYAASIQSGYLVRLDNAGGTFGAAQTVVTQLPDSVTSPVTTDDLTLFLSIGEQIGDDIHIAQRATTNDPFPVPTEVTELKTDAVQAAASWVSADNCRLYLNYTPTNGKPTIYSTSRPK